MRQRMTRKRRRNAVKAVSRGDEPPDPILTPTVIAAGLGAAGGIGSALINRSGAKAQAKQQPQVVPQYTSPLANNQQSRISGGYATGRQSLLGGY